MWLLNNLNLKFELKRKESWLKYIKNIITHINSI